MQAFVTLVTSDSYVVGATTLAASIRASNSSIPIIVLYSPDNISKPNLDKLYSIFHRVIAIPILYSNSSQNLILLGRPELDITYTKFHCWDPDLLWPYQTVCFLDADTLVLRNIDHIFNYVKGNTSLNIASNQSAVFAAAPDIGWPDCFNSGVLVLKPDLDIYRNLLKFAKECGSFDGGDQGVLNSFFSTWSTGAPSNTTPPSSRLPFTFNVTPSATYSYLPAYYQNYDNINIVHFIGAVKPWSFERFNDGSIVPISQIPNQTLHMVNKWWEFADRVTESSNTSDSKKADTGPVLTKFQRHFPAIVNFETQSHHPAFDTNQKRPQSQSSIDQTPRSPQRTPTNQQIYPRLPRSIIPIKSALKKPPPSQLQQKPNRIITLSSPPSSFSGQSFTTMQDSNSNFGINYFKQTSSGGSFKNASQLLSMSSPSTLDSPYILSGSSGDEGGLHSHIQKPSNSVHPNDFSAFNDLSIPVSVVVSTSTAITHREPIEKIRGPEINDFGNYRVDWNHSELKFSPRQRKLSTASSIASSSSADLTMDSDSDDELEVDDRVYIIDDVDDDQQVKDIREEGLRQLKLLTGSGGVNEQIAFADDDHVSVAGSSSNANRGVSIFGVGGSNFILDEVNLVRKKKKKISMKSFEKEIVTTTNVNTFDYTVMKTEVPNELMSYIPGSLTSDLERIFPSQIFNRGRELSFGGVGHASEKDFKKSTISDQKNSIEESNMKIENDRLKSNFFSTTKGLYASKSTENLEGMADAAEGSLMEMFYNHPVYTEKQSLCMTTDVVKEHHHHHRSTVLPRSNSSSSFWGYSGYGAGGGYNEGDEDEIEFGLIVDDRLGGEKRSASFFVDDDIDDEYLESEVVKESSSLFGVVANLKLATTNLNSFEKPDIVVDEKNEEIVDPQSSYGSSSTLRKMSLSIQPIALEEFIPPSPAVNLSAIETPILNTSHTSNHSISNESTKSESLSLPFSTRSVSPDDFCSQRYTKEAAMGSSKQSSSVLLPATVGTPAVQPKEAKKSVGKDPEIPFTASISQQSTKEAMNESKKLSFLLPATLVTPAVQTKESSLSKVPETHITPNIQNTEEHEIEIELGLEDPCATSSDKKKKKKKKNSKKKRRGSEFSVDSSGNSSVLKKESMSSLLSTTTSLMSCSSIKPVSFFSESTSAVKKENVVEESDGKEVMATEQKKKKKKKSSKKKSEESLVANDFVIDY